MSLADDCAIGQDFVVAAVVATEVPPQPTDGFSVDMIPTAIRAVCDVIRNRVMDPRFPKTPVEVVLQPGQFSAVCRQAYWRKAMAGTWFPAHVAGCLAAWREPVSGLTGGALWYYSPVSMIPPGSAPSWAAGRLEIIVPGVSGDYFRFYKEAA